MNWKEWLETKWGANTFAICAGVFLWVILNHLPAICRALATFIGFFEPVIYGMILAYIMDFPVRFFEHRILGKMPDKNKARGVAVVMTVILTVLLFVLLMAALIPQLVISITNLLNNWTTYITKLSTMIADLFDSAKASSVQQQISDWLTEGVSKLNKYIGDNSDNIITTITTVGSGFMDWFLAFILAIYFLVAKNWLLKSIKKLYHMLFPKKKIGYHIPFAKINSIFSRYVVCEIVDALIVGVANAIFMTIAGMPYTALISVIVGVTNLAPTFGPIIGALLGSFILLLVNPIYVVFFLIFTIILQFFDGYILKPKMYGSALSVPSVWILVAIIVLGRMFGVVGILLAIPVAAIITYIVSDYMHEKDVEMQKTA